MYYYLCVLFYVHAPRPKPHPWTSCHRGDAGFLILMFCLIERPWLAWRLSEGEVKWLIGAGGTVVRGVGGGLVSRGNP